MKHVKNFENIDYFMDNGGTEDEYLESPEYFVETYFNGGFSQLKRMLATFRSEDKMSQLIGFIKEMGNDEIIEWIAKN